MIALLKIDIGKSQIGIQVGRLLSENLFVDIRSLGYVLLGFMPVRQVEPGCVSYGE